MGKKIFIRMLAVSLLFNLVTTNALASNSQCFASSKMGAGFLLKYKGKVSAMSFPSLEACENYRKKLR
jgi:hypothetical protein